MSTARRGFLTTLAGAAIGAGLLTATPAEAAPPTLAISQSRPIRGETVTVRADLPGSGKRTIRLQRKSGKRWVTIASRRSDRKVAASFSRRFSSTVTLRAVTTGKKPRTSRRLTVRPVGQTARLHVAPQAGPGERLSASAVFTPARTRRAVSFQRWTDGAWRTVARGSQDARGRVTASLAPSTTRFRVVTAAARGAARYSSAAVSVATTPVPDLRCELPSGGTVRWGSGDTSHAVREPARLDVTTDDGQPITSRTEYARSSLVLTEPGAEPVSLGARLRLRGNSTSWISLKYPYKVKLDQAAGLRGMPASKDWVLLANFYDRSMLRNDAAFELSRRLGLDWTPRMQPVELWLNGTFRGLYQLGEGIETVPDRVDLPAGAVLLEADSNEDTDPSFRTARGLQVFVKSSSDPAVATTAAEQVRRVEDVLYSEHFAHPRYGYRACLDVGSFVDAYLMAEVTKNVDAAFKNSVWMVLGADGRLAMGPTWDHDQGLGNRRVCGIDDPTGWYVNRRDEAGCPVTQVQGPEGHWYQRLMADPWFVEQVRARWREVRAALAGAPDEVDAVAAVIADVAERNFAPTTEGGAGLPLGPTWLEDPTDHVFHDEGTWRAEASSLTTWLRARLAWLDGQLG